MGQGQFTSADVDKPGQFTAADVTAAPAPFNPPPTGTIQAKPSGGVDQWLQDLESDFRQGGSETFPGRMLKMMGAKGIDVGAQAGTMENTLMSPATGALQAAQGVAEGKPFKTAGGILKAASLPLQFMSPVTGEAGAQATSAIADAIPTRAAAGQALNEVRALGNNIPIDVASPGTTALRIQEMANRGGTLPKVIKDFIGRISDADQGPMNFPEARDFYQNATRLSADEFSKLTPNLQRMVGEFTNKLGGSIQEAADAMGQGDKFANAMKQYHQAATAHTFLVNLAKAVGYTAAAGALGSGAIRIGKALTGN